MKLKFKKKQTCEINKGLTIIQILTEKKKKDIKQCYSCHCDYKDSIILNFKSKNKDSIYLCRLCAHGYTGWTYDKINVVFKSVVKY